MSTNTNSPTSPTELDESCLAEVQGGTLDLQGARRESRIKYGDITLKKGYVDDAGSGICAADFDYTA